MKERIRKIKSSKKKGFTLIELVVVIAIMAILALIMVPNLTAYVQKADEAKIKANLKNVHTAAEVVQQSEGLSINNPDDELKFISKASEFSNINIGDLAISEEPILGTYTLTRDKDRGTITVKYLDKKNKIHVFDEYGYTGGEGDHNEGDSGEALYTKEEIDNLVNEGYIPIATVDELNKVRNGLSGKYIQVANIDLGGINNFEPIGTTDTANSFTGTYDGGGYTISNLKIDRDSNDYTGANDYTGLFGKIDGSAELKNIGLVNADVSGRNHVGGLVGGQQSGTITNSYASGSVNGGENVGGLVGYQSGGSITNSYASGSVNGVNYVGGLVGYQEGSGITNSYASGSVSGEKLVGGLVGYQDGGSITNSYASGSVSGTGHDVGGLVGYQYVDSTITNSYATGKVNGVKQVGGLVGYQFDATIKNSYWDKQTTGQTTSAGTGATGKTTAEMKNKDTYVGWDFTNIWEITNGQYPTLR